MDNKKGQTKFLDTPATARGLSWGAIDSEQSHSSDDVALVRASEKKAHLESMAAITPTIAVTASGIKADLFQSQKVAATASYMSMNEASHLGGVEGSVSAKSFNPDTAKQIADSSLSQVFVAHLESLVSGTGSGAVGGGAMEISTGAEIRNVAAGVSGFSLVDKADRVSLSGESIECKDVGVENTEGEAAESAASSVQAVQAAQDSNLLTAFKDAQAAHLVADENEVNPSGVASVADAGVGVEAQAVDNPQGLLKMNQSKEDLNSSAAQAHDIFGLPKATMDAFNRMREFHNVYHPKLEQDKLEQPQWLKPYTQPKAWSEYSAPVDAAASSSSVHSKAPVGSMKCGHMPCFFLFDYALDRYLMDAGSCRLLGLTYTGDWIPSHFIEKQISIVEDEKYFNVLFTQDYGDHLLLSVRVNHGEYESDLLYMSGSVIQRDDTGIALIVAGYFSRIQVNFAEYLSKIKNHSSAFDLDVSTGEIHYGPAYKELLGYKADDRLPKTLAEYEKQLIHKDDLNVFRRINDLIDNPRAGYYYEAIFRLLHKGGFYLWCIDRGLVVERNGDGRATRIIGTTTNIDILRSNFERLKRSIYQDPLTGLHNRLYLNTRYKYFTMEESQPLSLVYADISGLKLINDYLGHSQGDTLVRLAAQILQNDIYLDHEVVRLSGDEFLLIFTSCSAVECKLFINKFTVELNERNRYQEFPVPIFFGFGIATLYEIGEDDTFLRCEARADVRLQEYKTAHHDYIYAALRAFLENSLGQSIDLTDNRRLEYLKDRENSKSHSDQSKDILDADAWIVSGGQPTNPQSSASVQSSTSTLAEAPHTQDAEPNVPEVYAAAKSQKTSSLAAATIASTSNHAIQTQSTLPVTATEGQTLTKSSNQTASQVNTLAVDDRTDQVADKANVQGADKSNVLVEGKSNALVENNCTQCIASEQTALAQSSLTDQRGSRISGASAANLEQSNKIKRNVSQLEAQSEVEASSNLVQDLGDTTYHYVTVLTSNQSLGLDETVVPDDTSTTHPELNEILNLLQPGAKLLPSADISINESQASGANDANWAQSWTELIADGNEALKIEDVDQSLLRPDRVKAAEQLVLWEEASAIKAINTLPRDFAAVSDLPVSAKEQTVSDQSSKLKPAGDVALDLAAAPANSHGAGAYSILNDRVGSDASLASIDSASAVASDSSAKVYERYREIVQRRSQALQQAVAEQNLQHMHKVLCDGSLEVTSESLSLSAASDQDGVTERAKLTQMADSRAVVSPGDLYAESSVTSLNARGAVIDPEARQVAASSELTIYDASQSLHNQSAISASIISKAPSASNDQNAQLGLDGNSESSGDNFASKSEQNISMPHTEPIVASANESALASQDKLETGSLIQAQLEPVLDQADKSDLAALRTTQVESHLDAVIKKDVDDPDTNAEVTFKAWSDVLSCAKNKMEHASETASSVATDAQSEVWSKLSGINSPVHIGDPSDKEQVSTLIDINLRSTELELSHKITDSFEIPLIIDQESGKITPSENGAKSTSDEAQVAPTSATLAAPDLDATLGSNTASVVGSDNELASASGVTASESTAATSWAAIEANAASGVSATSGAADYAALSPASEVNEESSGAASLSSDAVLSDAAANSESNLILGYWYFRGKDNSFLLDKQCSLYFGIPYSNEWHPEQEILEKVLVLHVERYYKIMHSLEMGSIIFEDLELTNPQWKGKTFIINGSVLSRFPDSRVRYAVGYLMQVESSYSELIAHEIAGDGFFTWDNQSNCLHFSSSSQHLQGQGENDFNCSFEEWIREIVHPDDIEIVDVERNIFLSPNYGDNFEFCVRLRQRIGNYIWSISRGIVLKRDQYGHASSIIGTLSNINLVRDNFENIKQLLYTDTLTGLHNRAYFQNHMLTWQDEQLQPVSVIYADITGLKITNDVLGHADGDSLILAATDTLTNVLDEKCDIMRLSGDEFLVIIPHCDKEQSQARIDEMLDYLKERNKQKDSMPVFIGFGRATMGEVPQDTLHACIERADVRMQNFKDTHRKECYKRIQQYLEMRKGRPVSMRDGRRLEYYSKEERNKASHNAWQSENQT